MNPVALYLASGESLYPGAIILLAAILAAPFFRSRWLVSLRNIVVAIGLLLFLLACAPFAWITYAGYLAAFSAWFFAWYRRSDKPSARPLRIAAAAILAVLTLLLAALELPYRFPPALSGEQHTHLTVIGDSISAGIGGRYPPWPAVLQSQTAIPVTNLSRPGIGAADARALSVKVAPADTLVLLEIGGNDLLGDLPAADFERDLDRLLASLSAPGRTLIMFELPLLPHKISFGRAQRRLAEKYHVFLIPRRFFIDVLAARGATADGLHLSAVGAERMAALVGRLLAPVLSPATHPGPAPRPPG